MGYLKYLKANKSMKKCKSANSGYVSVTEHISYLELRPIVAGPSCHTYIHTYQSNISLRPYIKTSLTILSDTTYLPNSLPYTIRKDTI